jgi:hypothetical protein
MAKEKSEVETPVLIETPKPTKTVDNFRLTKDGFHVIQMGNFVLLFDKDKKYLDKLQNHKIQSISGTNIVNIVDLKTRELGLGDNPHPNEI